MSFASIYFFLKKKLGYGISYHIHCLVVNIVLIISTLVCSANSFTVYCTLVY